MSLMGWNHEAEWTGSENASSHPKQTQPSASGTLAPNDGAKYDDLSNAQVNDPTLAERSRSHQPQLCYGSDYRVLARRQVK